LYKRSNIKLSSFLPSVSAALRAALYGKTGSPRAARLAKQKFVSFAILSICFAQLKTNQTNL